MKVCNICGFETENGKAMSNHMRWKHLGVTFSEEAKRKLCKKKKRRITKKVKCDKCSKEFEVTFMEGHEKEKYYCSSNCSHSRTFDEAKKNRIRQSLYRTLKLKGYEKSSEKACPVCGKLFLSKAKTCSYQCGLSLRDRKDLSKKKDYKLACNFTFALNEYPEEFDFSLIEKYGWYKATNRGGDGSGVSRDHKISRDWAWQNKIDPKIIRHPANCELMIHSENFKKGIKCSISYDQLLVEIKRWDEKHGKREY